MTVLWGAGLLLFLFQIVALIRIYIKRCKVDHIRFVPAILQNIGVWNKLTYVAKKRENWLYAWLTSYIPTLNQGPGSYGVIIQWQMIRNLIEIMCSKKRKEIGITLYQQYLLFSQKIALVIFIISSSSCSCFLKSVIMPPQFQSMWGNDDKNV